MDQPNCRYRERLEQSVRDAVAHEKELESNSLSLKPERKLSNRSNVLVMT
jgi:hypothetical protein